MVMAGADGNAETVSRQWVTAEIFDVLGVKPIAGRMFLPSDEQQRASVVVLSEAFWRSRFNADPAVVGRELRLDGTLCTVVGIVPEDFQLLGRSSIWALRPFVNMPPRARGAHMLQARRPPEARRRDRRPRRPICRRSPRAWRASSRRPTPAAASRSSRCTTRSIGGDLRRDVDAVPRRRRLRAADLLRQRRQPAAGARDRADARAGDARRARRRPPPHRPPAAHREPRALARSAARSASRVGAAIIDAAPALIPRGAAAGDRHALLRPARRRVLRRRRARSSACCSASRRRGRRRASRRRPRSAPTGARRRAAAAGCAACW